MPTATAPRMARAKRNWALVRSMLSLHPRPFAIAFVGAAVFALGTVASSFAIRKVIDDVILPRFDDGSVPVRTVLGGLGLIVGIGLIRAAGVVFRRAFASIGMWRVAQSYTTQVLRRLTSQPVGWHRRHADGDLLARAGVDTETTVSVIAPIPFATSTVLMIFVSSIWLFIIDIPIGVLALVVFPLLIGTNVIYERAVTVHYTRAQEQLGTFSAAVHESFEGIQLIKAYGAEARETTRLAELAREVRDSRMKAIRLRSWFEALLDLVPSLTNVLLVVLGAIRVDSGDITVGQFSGVIFLFTLLVLPLRLIGYALSELPRSMAAWNRIQAVVAEPIEPDPRRTIGSAEPGIGVELSSISYHHHDGHHHDGPFEADLETGNGTDPLAALSDVSLRLAAGSITAIVGPTGAGKSTLADIISGLISPTDGQVSVVDGQRSIVFQEAFLLAGSVRENIEFGGLFDDDAIWNALALASAADFVRSLPEQLDTVVGERGVSLSGGQRQRVALARALVRRPALLILDDTTSALDPATEAIVLENLRRALAGTTVVLIASRPSTIALADDVVFLTNGRVTGHGTHDQLLQDDPSYRELVEAFEADRDTSLEASS